MLVFSSLNFHSFVVVQMSSKEDYKFQVLAMCVYFIFVDLLKVKEKKEGKEIVTSGDE